MARLKDVAEKAGVSITTASHALNRTRFVQEETSRRVFEAAAELGYSPNRVAQGLRTGNSKTIAVLGPSATDPFFAEVVRGVEEYCAEREYEVFLGFVEKTKGDKHGEESDDKAEEAAFSREMLRGNFAAIDICKAMRAHFATRESDLLARFLSRNVDGLILNMIQDDQTVENLLGDLDVPFILFYRSFPGRMWDSLLSDDYAGMRAALEHLISLGHRRLAMVYGYSWSTHAARDRFRAWVDVHRAHGISLEENLLREGRYDYEHSARVTEELLRAPNPPTAICYWSDAMALSGMQAAFRMGLSVPEDVSILGFDDLQFSAYTWPSLATIRQERIQSGRMLAERLVARIEGSAVAAGSQIRVATRFLARDSIGARR